MNNYYEYPFSNQFEPLNQYLPQSKQMPIDSYEGFIRGNMFDSLYKPYTTAEPYNLSPRDERDGMLDKVREYNFAMIDLNLYLDNHPDDQQMIKLYSDYCQKYLNAMNEYEQKYGPLTVTSETLSNTPWQWLDTPWSWEER